MFIDENVEKILDISLQANRYRTTFDFIEAISLHLEDLGSFDTLVEATAVFHDYLNAKVMKAKAFSASPGAIPLGWEIAKKNPFLEKNPFEGFFFHEYLITNPLPFDFDLLETLSGTALFNKLDLKMSESVSIASLVRCKIAEKEHLLLAETVGRGRELNSFIKREQDFLQIKTAVEKTALAIGELHSIKKGSVDLWSKRKETYEKEDLEEQLRFCKDKHFAFEKLEETAWKLYEKALKCPFQSGYCHGDFSLHNVTYSRSRELVTFIDLATAHKSFDKDLNPIGYIPNDYAMFVFGLERVLYKSSHEHRFEELLQYFEENYQKQAGCLPEKEHLDYNFLTHALSKLKQSVYLHENTNEPIDGTHSTPFLENYIQRQLAKI